MESIMVPAHLMLKKCSPKSWSKDSSRNRRSKNNSSTTHKALGGKIDLQGVKFITFSRKPGLRRPSLLGCSSKTRKPGGCAEILAIRIMRNWNQFPQALTLDGKICLLGVSLRQLFRKPGLMRPSPLSTKRGSPRETKHFSRKELESISTSSHFSLPYSGISLNSHFDLAVRLLSKLALMVRRWPQRALRNQIGGTENWATYQWHKGGWGDQIPVNSGSMRGDEHPITSW